MKNIKNDIPAIAGLLTTASLAVVFGGLINPALDNAPYYGRNTRIGIIHIVNYFFQEEQRKKNFSSI